MKRNSFFTTAVFFATCFAASANNFETPSNKLSEETPTTEVMAQEAADTQVNGTSWWVCTANRVIVRIGPGTGYKQARDPHMGHAMYLNRGDVLASDGVVKNGFRRVYFSDGGPYWVCAKYLERTAQPYLGDYD